VREIRMLRSTRRGLEPWHGRDGVTLADERARQRGTQTSTYTGAPVLDPTDEGDRGNRINGPASKAPPDERGGNRYAGPTGTAPHPYSTATSARLNGGLRYANPPYGLSLPDCYVAGKPVRVNEPPSLPRPKHGRRKTRH
jgi:hypothetical protein